MYKDTRRALLFAPFATFIAAIACKTRLVQAPNAATVVPTPEVSKPIPAGTDPVDPTQSLIDACGNMQACGGSIVVQTDKIPVAGQALDAKRIIYGPLEHALVVVQLLLPCPDQLVNIYLLDECGHLLAQRGINSSFDIDSQKKLKPMIFENLNLINVKKVHILWQLSNLDAPFRFKSFSDDIAVIEVFEGVPVDAVSIKGVPGSFLSAGPLVDPLYLTKSMEIEPTLQNVPPFFVPLSDTAYCANSSLGDAVVTDIMGNVLARYGATFNTPLDQELVVIYSLTKNNRYLRRIVQFF